MSLIHQSGGGTGFSFSDLRPRGDLVRSTVGVASGPVSFMRIFDVATDVIKQGGRRRGANMSILSVHHPDILEFIESKGQEGVLSNFNISVAITDQFMDALAHDTDYPLINPRNGQEVRRLPASEVFERIALAAWKTGDPGLVFTDEINRYNPTPSLGNIEATNPCGEVPLLAYESCNLGSINLAKLVKDGKLDWNALKDLVWLGVRFLDDVIEASQSPLPEIDAMVHGNRKIGLGVMGFADAIIQMGIPYDSPQAVETADKIMSFVAGEARSASASLAQERGAFPNFAQSVHAQNGHPPMRNATVCSVAPTGTISLIAGCSSGIEPLFAISYVREALEGVQLLEVNPHFQAVAREQGFDTPDLMPAVARLGSVQSIEDVPEDVRRIFVTDFDIAPEWHVRAQAAFQRHTDNAVSKTVNLPHDATVRDVRDIFLMAHREKCKGITVYRYGSKQQQVLHLGGLLREEQGEKSPYLTVHSEYAGGCADENCVF
jgi:ribonucleoside-diphosphate reductase alpha chain